MFQIQHLQKRLAGDVNVRAIANLSGVSEKTIHRIKASESDTTFNTANKIIAALDKLYPVKRKAEKAAA